jgi:hypothetical protein
VVAAPAINSTLTIVEDVSTSVQTTPTLELGLFPNPAEDVLRVRSTQDLANRTVLVTDVTGKEVLRTTLRNGALDVSDLTGGLYVLHILGEGASLQAKFLKQ